MRSPPICPLLSTLAFLVAMMAGPSAALSGTGGAGGGGSGGAAGGGGQGGAGGGGQGGTGGGDPVCENDGLCQSKTEDCSCADCKDLALCVPDQCIVDGVCTLEDACTCVDCRRDEFCQNPAHCIDDGVCEAFDEGCQCEDCAAEPACQESSPTTAAATSGGADRPRDDGGCSARPGAADPWLAAFALLAAAAVAAGVRGRPRR